MRTGVQSDLSGYDALGCVELGEGEQKLIVVSPNVVYIPEYRDAILGGSGPRVFDDGMYGFDEVCKWPGPLNYQNRHLACVPLPPKFREGYRYMNFSGYLSSLSFNKVECLWERITPKDFTNSIVRLKHSDPQGYGTITRPVLDRIVCTTEYVNTLRHSIIPNLSVPEEDKRVLENQVKHLYLRISDVLACIRSFNDKWIPTLFRYRELQRCNLEILGHLILFGEVYELLKSGLEKPPNLTFPILGAFVSMPKDMSTCIRGGIPCWRVVPEAEFSNDRIKFTRSVGSLPLRGLLSLENFKAPNGDDFILYRDCKYNQHSDFGPERDIVSNSGLRITLLPSGESKVAIIGDNAHLREDIISALADKNLCERFSQHPVSFVARETQRSTLVQDRHLPSNFNSMGPSSSSLISSRMRGITFNKALGDFNIFRRDDIVANFWFSVREISTMDSPYSHAVGSVYAFPTPTLFNETKNDNRGERFIVWLSMRLMWIHSAFTANGHQIKPLSTETWRMLTSGMVPFVEIKPRRHNGKFDRRQVARQFAQSLREIFGLGDYHPGLTGDWGNKIFTASKITVEVQAEIVYELHHMNFLSDFLSLDALEMTGLRGLAADFDIENRKNIFLGIFRHETILDPEEVRFPDVWSLTLPERRSVLRPWFQLMMEWPSCPSSLSMIVVDNIDDEQFKVFERGMIRMYVLFFARSFRRYPVLPIVRPLSLQTRYENWLKKQPHAE